MANYMGKPREAYLLSMAGGVLIAVAGLWWIAVASIGWPTDWFGWFGTMMHDFDGHFLFWDMASFGYAMGISGLVLGTGIILASFMLSKRPSEHGLWGIVIIVLSAASAMGGMGGMGIGLLLGIVGGILAVLWQPANIVQGSANQQEGA